MASHELENVQENFYRSAGSAGIAMGITAIIGFICFTVFGFGIETTMQWLIVLCLIAGGGTFTGVSWATSASSNRRGPVPA